MTDLSIEVETDDWLMLAVRARGLRKSLSAVRSSPRRQQIA